MATIFRRVVAEISPVLVEIFPTNFNIGGMLAKICENVGVKIDFTSDSYSLEGDWQMMEKVHNMLLDLVAGYGTHTAHVEHLRLMSQSSRQFSVLVEAAEALSRGVELQEHKLEGTLPTSNSQELSNVNIQLKDENQQKYPVYCRDIDSNFHQEHLTESSYGNGSDNSIEHVIEIKSGYPYMNEQSCTDTHSDSVSSGSGCNASVCETVSDGKKNEDIVIETDWIEEEIKKSDLKSEHTVYSCNLCNYKTESKSTLTYHKKTIHCGDITKCDLCSKVFTNYRYMKRHRDSHSEAKYTCEICGKCFKICKALKDHKKQHSNDYIKPVFKCGQCLKSFSTNYLLLCHIKSAHLGIKTRFLCPTCGKSFTSNHTMQQHMNAHAGIKPYACNKCGKGFSYETALRDHRLIHEETKNFVCVYPHCNKAFKQRSALKMHSKIHADGKDFVCKDCGRGFTQKQALARHNRSHKGLKPYSCKYCGRIFGDPSIVRRHLKLVHKINKDIQSWREDIIENKIVDENVCNKLTKGKLINKTIDKTTVSVKSLNPEISQTLSQVIQCVPIGNNKYVVKNDEITENDGSINAEDISLTFQGNKRCETHSSLLSKSAAEIDNMQGSSKIKIGYSTNNTQSIIHYNFADAELLPTTNKRIMFHEETRSESFIPLEEESFVHVSDKEQYQFLNENLDGTFTSEVSTGKLKKNREVVALSHGIDTAILAYEPLAEQLKPDGTMYDSSVPGRVEQLTKVSDTEQLIAENVTLQQLYAYYSNISQYNVTNNETDNQPSKDDHVLPKTKPSLNMHQN